MNTEFTRKARVGINPLTIKAGDTRYLAINSPSVEVFQKKDGETVDFVMATDMQTGEEGHFWLAGQARHALEQLQSKYNSLKGLKIEITHKGKTTAMIGTKEQEVNQFDIYELN